MCGLVGIFHRDRNEPVDESVLRRMMDAVAHRGPDDQGLFVAPGVGLGHRRLAVIDIRGGHQPMTDEVAGKTIVYNGEVYNYRRIKESTPAKLEGTHTDSDTEIVLKLADAEDVDWLGRLNGMFALAVYDRRSDLVVLARDRFGVKPLYYAITPRGVVFGSEIKALFEHPDVRPVMRDEAIPEYLAFRSCVGAEAFFKGIRALEPGRALVLRRGLRDLAERTYWQEPASKEIDPSTDPAKRLSEVVDLLKDSVRLRLIADVPVGAYASGGIDSTLVTWAMREVATGELHTFSVGFQEDAFDESTFAETVATRLQTLHHRLVIDKKAYADLLPRTVWCNDEPLAHPHTPQLLELSRIAKTFVTVVLTGEGADEVFGGYPRYQIPVLARNLSWIPRPIARALQRFATAAGARRLEKLFANMPYTPRAIIDAARFEGPDLLESIGVYTGGFPYRQQLVDGALSNNETLLEAALEYERKAYLPALLHRLDRTTMAHGLEAREPFLDFRLVEMSKLLPTRDKLVPGRETKRILKEAALRVLPRSAVFRRKAGFGVPVGEWLRDRGSLGRYLDILTDETFRQRGYCDTSRVAILVDRHVRREEENGDILWTLMALELWLRTYIDGGRPRILG